jgi:hypothetical protein
MEILRQSITYAIITVVKNYCKFPHQGDPIKKLVIPTELDNVFFDVFKLPMSLSPKYLTIPLFKHEKGAKTKYYYTNEDLGDEKSLKIPFELAFKNTFSGGIDGEFFTTKDRHIKKHYVNPFARILIVTTERTIKLVDGKVIARTYKRTRSRDLNSKYFKIRTNSEVISFNLNNGDINVGESNRRNKGVKTNRFRRNSFGVIENLIGSNGFFKITNNVSKNSPVFNEFKKEMDDDVFLDRLLIEIGQHNDTPITLIDNEDKLKLRLRFIDFLVKHKKIKTPNDYHKLITMYYPGEVYLKKNGRKLIQSSLDSYGILSKLTNKMLHTHVDIDIKHLALFCGFFGNEYTKHIGNLKPRAYDYFKSITSQPYSAEPIKERKNYRRFNLEDSEKENIIKITNSLVDTKSVSDPLRSVSGIYSLFVDHLDMITQIREFDPNFRMRATNYDDFHTEHIELSKMIATIRKGWSTEYVFDNRMVRKVEEPFNLLGADLVERKFTPHILKRDEEYSEEGSFMHHCVASYANKESSIVISLRTDDEKDRVTCEFDKKTGECIQERHFCNRIPPEHFTEPLRLLRGKVKRFSHQRLLTHLETKKVRVKINGKEVPIAQLQGGNGLNLPNHHLFGF